MSRAVRKRPDLLAKVLLDRQHDREDLEIQIECAMKSARRGFYATARAELRGAMLILTTMERRIHGGCG